MARWKRISVELSHTWPGEAYLRFEAADGTATMVAVDQDDLAGIGQLDGALGRPADADKNLYVWPGKDGRSVDVALAASGERAREMVGDSPGRGPAGQPFVFRLSGIVEYEQHYREYRAGG